ncbi:hypothetical protein JTE90_018080 [Oedothorax gibbosus]|uniref:Uncharacterized protein n=1 Tax=Oedothorax gibbosus TaxID=931172 RepID=A0AAV6UD50_9ARAC|nr:hypothetical protein JTE90_018080 [Oedothorax gibbosus]
MISLSSSCAASPPPHHRLSCLHRSPEKSRIPRQKVIKFPIKPSEVVSPFLANGEASLDDNDISLGAAHLYASHSYSDSILPGQNNTMRIVASRPYQDKERGY